MAGKKRSATDFPNITRSEFAKILERARKARYVRCPYLTIRDASLIAFEFLFKTRVSESVGRVFPEDIKDRERSSFLDRYEGIRLKDFDVATVRGREVLRCRFRVLKRGCRKKICENCSTRNELTASFCKKCGSTLERVKLDSRLKEHYVWDSVRLDDPFVYYIIDWLGFLRRNFKDMNPRVWGITRQRSWQICKRLAIMNHTQRHWRATQLSDTMDPFTLKEALHRATMPFEYVHRAESRRLEREEEADKIWA
jgi:ribosomal protein L40E